MEHLLPPRLVGILLLVAVPLGLLVPIVGWLPLWSRLAGLGAVLVGALLNVANAQRFRRLKTNIRTFDPPELFVRTGAFRFTRNPMYLGFLVILVGVALAVGSLSVWIAPIVFFVFANAVYIPFEEREMETRFGDDYARYRSDVGRWVGPGR